MFRCKTCRKVLSEYSKSKTYCSTECDKGNKEGEFLRSFIEMVTKGDG